MEWHFKQLMTQLTPVPTMWAPHAAHEFLRRLPEIDNDFWLSVVIPLTFGLPDLELETLSQLHLPGPKSAVQMYNLFALRLRFEKAQSYVPDILAAARKGALSTAELSGMPIRNLLIEHGLLAEVQQTYVKQRFPHDARERLPDGDGIWLGCDANVGNLKFSLQAILDHSQDFLERINLVLLSANGRSDPALLEVAKKFKRAVMVHYSDELELVERLRGLKMNVFIELHGLQNPSTFVEKLGSGVANIQLSWAGQPENCPLPFIDAQILDPVLEKSTSLSCRSIPLRCWLPPVRQFPAMVRGESLGIWSLAQKLTPHFLSFCTKLASRTGRNVQIWTGAPVYQAGVLPGNVQLVSQFDQFRPAVMLDTFPLSGGNACLFSLLNQIPVVTMPGEHVASRLGASVLLNYGFPEGLVNDLLAYEQRVVEFCQLRSMPQIPRQIEWEFVRSVERFSSSLQD